MDCVYPAVFYEEDGKISVVFPDLGNLAAFGDNIADAMHMAQDACGNQIHFSSFAYDNSNCKTHFHKPDIVFANFLHLAYT